jgi:hypothetical protein
VLPPTAAILLDITVSILRSWLRAGPVSARLGAFISALGIFGKAIDASILLFPTGWIVCSLPVVNVPTRVQ